MVNLKKVAIIGCGRVGSTIAFNLIQADLFSEMVLIDINHQKAEGEVMDLSHSSAFSSAINLYAGNYDDIVDAGLIIITAGVGRKPNESRLDLMQKNVEIFKNIIPEIKARQCEGVLFIISNPVDILTYVTLKLSGFESHRVIGSGTILDTARLKTILATYLKVSIKDVDAYVLGEHGNSALTPWSKVQIQNKHISQYLSENNSIKYDIMKKEIEQIVLDCGKEIIKRKDATFYGVSACVKKVAKSIVNDEKIILPISTLLQGQYGIDNICLSALAIISHQGIEKIVEVDLNENELKELKESAMTLKDALMKLNI